MNTTNNRKETNMDNKTKHKINLKGHKLNITEDHNDGETRITLTSNVTMLRSVSIHISNDGDLQVFTRGLNMYAGNVKKRTKNLCGSKYIVLSPKRYELGENYVCDRIFIDV
jgi:DNA topoisomerase IB